MYLEFLDMVKGKRIKQMFFGNTSLVPEHKRKDIKLFFDQCLKDDWVYVTKEKESIVGSFSKNDFVKILKDNNLTISGNKIDLVERIDSNLGLKMFYETGNVSDWIRLTDLGKLKLKEYRSDFNKKYLIFKQKVFFLFMSNKISESCYNVYYFKQSYPFERAVLGTPSSSSLEDELLQNIDTCKMIMKSDILIKIGVPEIYRDDLLSIICTNKSLGYSYEEELEEKYNGFEELLIKSDLIINKNYAFSDFNNLLNGFEVRKFDF